MDGQKPEELSGEYEKIEIASRVIRLYKRQIDPEWTEQANVELENEWASLVSAYPNYHVPLRVLHQRLDRSHQASVLFPEMRPMMEQLVKNEGITSDPVTMSFISDVSLANITAARGEFDAPILWMVAEAIRVSDHLKQTTWGRITFQHAMLHVFNGNLTDSEALFRVPNPSDQL